jgi:hypothetical protein
MSAIEGRRVVDSNVEPRPDVALWNETRWNGCWNAEEGTGLYLHAGRYRPDLDMWWAQVVAYLPDDELCVVRCFGRNEADDGVRIGGLDLAMTEDGWTATFDGVGELTNIAALAQGARGASAPLRSFRFSVTATGCAPVWDMHEGADQSLDFAGDAHVQQAYTTAGALTVGDTTYGLGGIGFKDHSSGVRDFSGWFGHRFFLVVADDWACHAVVLYSPEGTPRPALGAYFAGGHRRRVTGFDLPLLADSAGGPVTGEAVIELDGGERLTFASELVHALPTLMTIDNEYVNGVDWDMPGDPIVLIEGKGRLVAPDGSTAYCFHERSALRSAVARPVDRDPVT